VEVAPFLVGSTEYLVAGGVKDDIQVRVDIRVDAVRPLGVLVGDVGEAVLIDAVPRRAVEARCLRESGDRVGDEYVPMMLEELALDGNDSRAPRWSREVPAAVREKFHVLVIGGGMSGLLQALRLMMGTRGDSMDFLQADNQMRTFAKESGGMAFFPRFYAEIFNGTTPAVADLAAGSFRGASVFAFVTPPPTDERVRRMSLGPSCPPELSGAGV